MGKGRGNAEAECAEGCIVQCQEKRRKTTSRYRSRDTDFLNDKNSYKLNSEIIKYLQNIHDIYAKSN